MREVFLLRLRRPFKEIAESGDLDQYGPLEDAIRDAQFSKLSKLEPQERRESK
jgi:hypothetical protein